jgi:hypothetical protein
LAPSFLLRRPRVQSAAGSIGGGVRRKGRVALSQMCLCTACSIHSCASLPAR